MSANENDVRGGYDSRDMRPSPQPTRVRSEDMPSPQQRPVYRAEGVSTTITGGMGGNVVRAMTANLQKPGQIAVGLALIGWSIFCSAYIGIEDAGIFWKNDTFQLVAGFMFAFLVTIIQLVAIANPTPIAKRIYFFVVVLDAFYTARMNHGFSMLLVTRVVLAPVVIVGCMNYIGMFMQDMPDRKAIPITISGSVVAAGLLLIATAYGNPIAINYIVFGIDLVGGYWTSRLGEEALLGKRIQLTA